MNDITNVIASTADVNAADSMPVMVPEKFVAAVFAPFKKKFNAAKKIASTAAAYDITTTAGMSQAKELRASFRDIRTSLENERKARKAPIIEAGKLLDQRAAELRAEIEPLEGKYDGEIKAEEQRKAEEKARKEAIERARVEAIEGRIAFIRNAPSQLVTADSSAIRKVIDHWTVLRLDPDDYNEYLEDALRTVNDTIEQLGALLVIAEEREAEARRIAAEREELARFRAEQEERDRMAAAEAAERERLAQIERDKAEAERRAAAEREAEQQRQMAVMKAEQERNLRIMQDIKDIQARGSLNVSLRALAPALDETRALVVDEATFGSMVSMAQMAKDMAIAALEAKFNAALAAEMPLVHAEALEMNQGVDVAIAELARLEKSRSVAMEIPPLVPAHRLAAPILQPEFGEIIEVLAVHYGVSEDTVTRWLVEGVNGLSM